MTGSFINYEACAADLRNQGFKYDSFDLFINTDTKEVAYICKYLDGSVSPLITYLKQ